MAKVDSCMSMDIFEKVQIPKWIHSLKPINRGSKHQNQQQSYQNFRSVENLLKSQYDPNTCS